MNTNYYWNSIVFGDSAMAKFKMIRDDKIFYELKAEKARRQDKLIADIKEGRVDGMQAFSDNSCFSDEAIKNFTPSFGKSKEEPEK